MSKRNFFGRLLGLFFILLYCGGCQSGSASWQTLTPKRKVPPLETTEEAKDEKILDSEPLEQATPVQEEEGVVQQSLHSFTVDEPVAKIADCLPDSQYVAKRLDLYEKKQAHWQNVAATFLELDLAMEQPARWEECTALIGRIIIGYTGVRDLAHGGVTRIAATPTEVFGQEISYLESDCEEIFVQAVAATPGALQNYREIISSQAEAVLFFYAGQEQYDKVIAAYEDLQAISSGGNRSAQVREVYAQALRATGQMAQASRVLLEIADAKGDGQGWPQRLQAAELLFAQGEFARARQQYQRVAVVFADWQRVESEVKDHVVLLSDFESHPKETSLYGQALYGWLLFDGSGLPRQLAESVARLEREFAETDHARMARQLLNKASGSAGEYVDLQLQVAGDLVAEKEFFQALELLGILSKSSLPDEKAQLVEETLREVQLLNEQDIEEKKILKEQELADSWQEALHLFDQRKFDLAIAGFEALLSTSYQQEAKMKIVAAANLAAADLRKQAAGLFVKSRKVTHPEQKTDLLMKSRRLLLLIQKKYPEADVIPKVIQNQSAIEEQIRAIDSDLLEDD